MSSHSHHEGTRDKPREKRPEVMTQIPLLSGQQARFAEMISQGALSGAVKPLVSRPIAPAPGTPIAAGTVSATKIINQQGQHMIIPKASACTVGGRIEAISLPGSTQTVAVNLSTQSAAHVSGSQALHITMPAGSAQSLHPLTLPTTLMAHSTGGLVQAQTFSQAAESVKERSHVTVMPPGMITDQDRTRQTHQIPMASLIRTGSPQIAAPNRLTGHPGANPHTSNQPTTMVVGASANFSLAHTAPQQTVSSQASIIHALPPSHIPRGAAAASALAATRVGAVATPILRSQAVTTVAQMSSNSPLLPNLAAHLQPRGMLPVRPGTPPSTLQATTAHSQADIQRVASGHIMATLAGNQGVQITSIQGRPVLSQVTGAKVTQPLVQQGFTGQTQKVMSQSVSQLLAQGTGGPTLVSVPTPKLAGISLTQQPGGATVRTQKIMTTQASLPTPTQVSIANLAGGQTLNLAHTLPRGPKIVTTQTPGTMVVNTAQKGINIGHAVPTALRPQKLLMSQMTGGSVPTTIPVTVSTIPKLAVGVHGNQPVMTVSTPNMVSTTTLATIPINKKALKVPAQTIQRATVPHVAMTAPHTPQEGVQKEGGGLMNKPPMVHHSTQPQLPQTHNPQLQASLFGLSAAQRHPVTQSSSTAITAQAPVQTEPRPQDSRPAFPPHFPVSIQDLSSAGYYNLVYPFAAGSTIRPGIVQAAQAGNLGAALQAAPGTAIAMTTANPSGVRINPSLMVNVDPNHPTAISMTTQFAGVKPADVAGSVTTTGSHGTQPANQQPGPGGQPANASPRPSILRKRPHPQEGLMVVKKNLLASVNAVEANSNSNSTTDSQSHNQQPAPSPKALTPCDPSRENSQSSTDTASSNESTPLSGNHGDIKIKTEPTDCADTVAAAGALTMFGQLQNNVEASPRKKPRKQSLHANEELQDGDGGSSDEELNKLARDDIKQELEWCAEAERKLQEEQDDMDDEDEDEEEEEEDIKETLAEYVDVEGVRWTRDRPRQPAQLLNHYACNWKPRNNHYSRYQDVKSKEERRPTVNELANQKGIHQKASGWKIYHLAAQLEELMDMEKEVFNSMSVVQDVIAPKHIAKNPTMEDDISMVHELTQGNIQRCQLVMDQLEEARASMVKVLDHKSRISDIINKHHSKRPVKKKERI